MLATSVTAGPNGGWGKGLLSETLLFHVDDAETPDGYLYWNPDLTTFRFDFHGYYLDAGMAYYLVAYEGSPDDEPDDPLVLGDAVACDYYGVHIKDDIAWPGLSGATLCLVPETYEGFGGEDGWMPDTYQVAGPVDLTQA